MGFSEFENRRIEKTVNAFLEKRRPPSDLRKKLDLWEGTLVPRQRTNETLWHFAPRGIRKVASEPASPLPRMRPRQSAGLLQEVRRRPYDQYMEGL
jgi:hypothetical protein